MVRAADPIRQRGPGRSGSVRTVPKVATPSHTTLSGLPEAEAAWVERARTARARSALERTPELVPPPRFGRTRFEAYRVVHPSGADARDRVRAAAQRASDPRPRARRPWWRPWRRTEPLAGTGLFLDGGFGVGKTHLLAAAWHEAPLPEAAKPYLSFQELVHRIGALGREGARAAFAEARLLCLDEFELDDPGNTLIIATFLADLFARGATVLTTSNTPPDRQGEGRFAADDFRREILGIADRFETVRIVGPDQRATAGPERWSTPEEVAEALAHGPVPVASATGERLSETLASVHPVRYGRLLAGVGTVVIRELRPLPDANEALRFVHFVDKAYDLGVRFRVAGTASPETLFDASYAGGAWAKKFLRCRSRLTEMAREPLDRLP